MSSIFGKYRRYLPIVSILLLAAILRLYRIGDYMTFLGDEGRDALVWLRMVREGKFVLIGPVTSIGNMYLGPLYYYLMLPFFILFQLSPIGPSVGVAVFSLLTILFLWYVVRVWFGELAALCASFFYAISPVVIHHSRSSWNPNVMPFFALLIVWGIWQFWQKRSFVWLIIMGIALAFAVQSHYLGILLLPLILLFWAITFWNIRKSKKELRKYFLFSFLSVLAFGFLAVLPLVWFDLRHNFINLHAFQNFFGDRQTTVNFKAYKAVPNLWPLWQMVVERLIVAKEVLLGKIIAIAFLPLLFFYVLRLKANLKKQALLLVGLWLVIGLVGMGLYKQHIYDHYFGFLFPAVFVILGVILDGLFQQKLLGKAIFMTLILLLVYLNIKNSPINYSPNFQAERVKQVDQKIMAEAGDKSFNFSLIAKQNYEAGYTFYLEYWHQKPKEINAQQINETLADQLFVVCEDPVCEPINHPKAEIANFGWAKIEKEWSFPWGVKLFKLVHVQDEK